MRLAELQERRIQMGEGVLVHVTDQEFEQEVLKSDIPALVDFWAPWCGPCHMVAPAVEGVAEKFSGKIKICRLSLIPFLP